MAINQFSQPHFHDEEAARAWFEAAHWPNGPICPHCNGAKHYATKKVGRYRCAAPECRKDFTVMTGTVMERSHAKLTQWAAAFHLAASSKKGFSAHQLHRELGCQYNTAWFLHHRVMEAMRRGGLDIAPMGGEGSTVEADETFIGKKEGSTKRRGHGHKNAVLSLVEAAARFALSMLMERAPPMSCRSSVRAMTPSITKPMNMFAMKANGSSLQTRSKVIFPFLNAGCAASISIAAKSIFTAISQNSISATIIVSRLALMTQIAQLKLLRGADGKRLTYHQPHKA
jgi:transposase-like protein